MDESMDVETASSQGVPESQVQTQMETQTEVSTSSSSRTEDLREHKARQIVVVPDDLAKYKWRRGESGRFKAFSDTCSRNDVPMESLRPAYQPLSAEQQIPSTPGGLIIPPFPPRPSSRASHGQGMSRLPVGDLVEVDEEAVIGGRTLKSEMEPNEAWSFLRDLFKELDEFKIAPPFTIQRICELAWKPFLQHTSIGKYLRAVQKNVLVTTTYDVTYGAVESSEQQASGGAGRLGRAGLNGHTDGPRSRASSVSSTSSTSSQSTPLFTPIPFLLERNLINPDGTPVSSPAIRPRSPPSASDSDVPTSALSLNLKISTRSSQSDNIRDVNMEETGMDSENRPGTPLHEFNQQSIFRGETSNDERESIPQRPPPNQSTASTSGVASSAAQHISNGSPNGSPLPSSLDTVANEPFTGRVDELDAGPLLQPAGSPDPSDPHQLHLPLSDDGFTETDVSAQPHQEGTGERGTMTPHAMSDRPQAISSTTDLTAVPPISLLHSAAHHQPIDTPPASPSGGRTLRGLPRTASVSSSLNERFVSGEILPPNVPRNEAEKAGGAEADEAGKSEGQDAGHASKTPKLI
ncbi:hypothetical protein QFC19_001055 [Naganishia cerealis]|uniref:Uncharacterized protein n=1 Tax=Naganishia cerealis TaxID=610337 RepID=A0ACC2WJU6_9TREE|nr:hypothetical protein QFC19_001055 [Naganishia cerealis]